MWRAGPHNSGCLAVQIAVRYRVIFEVIVGIVVDNSAFNFAFGAADQRGHLQQKSFGSATRVTTVMPMAGSPEASKPLHFGNRSFLGSGAQSHDTVVLDNDFELEIVPAAVRTGPSYRRRHCVHTAGCADIIPTPPESVAEPVLKLPRIAVAELNAELNRPTASRTVGERNKRVISGHQNFTLLSGILFKSRLPLAIKSNSSITTDATTPIRAPVPVRNARSEVLIFARSLHI
ncbi:MAG: hypothetical protein LC772_01240 [Chloroflexi bacterium]|nr:hypothetical protein [Chloroflexota bacterium]